MKRQPTDRCRALLEQVSRYLDGDLTAAERRAVGRHLRTCPCCQHMADGLKHTVEACRKAGTSRLPPDVRTRAKARITTLLASGPVTAPRR
jgi:anti-sigma factor RsiW